MFDNSAQGDVAEPSFLYLVMAATYFRQASHTRQPHVRKALRDFGREYVNNAGRVVTVYSCPVSGRRRFKSNTQS